MSITDVNVYVSIIIEKIVNELDIRKHNTGRQNKMPLMFYINKIICVLRTGISWKDLDLFKQPNEPSSDTIRKKHNKWIKLGVYDQIVKQLEDKYLNDYKEIITEYFIDSTLLNNHNGTSVMAGFCYKLKGKRSMKANFISDNNMIMYEPIISNSQPHDSTFIEPLIDLFPSKLTENATYNNCLTITGDAGYLINKQSNLNLRNTKHISINAAYKKNMKRRKNEPNRKLLKKRHKIENVNAVLKRSHKRTAVVKDRKMEVLKTWFTLARIMIISKFLIQHKKIIINNKKRTYLFV